MRRIREPEVMDDEALAAPLHRDALSKLARINALSFAAKSLCMPLGEFARDVKDPLRVLDLACGGGDVVTELWRAASRESLDLQFSGCDKSAIALDVARERAKALAAPIEFFALDILKERIPERFDVVINSLFLHHFDPPDVIGILAKLARTRLVLVSDLRRSRTGLVLAHLAGHIFARSPVVRVDGPRSVHAAYTIAELNEMARIAGLNNATIERRWPCRMLLEWKR